MNQGYNRSSGFCILLSSFALFAQQLYADTLTVYNHARYPVCACIYYVDTDIWQTSIGPAIREHSFIEIPARSQGVLERPAFVPLVNREIIFSAKSKDLAEKLEPNDYKKAAVHPAGWRHGTTYHIAEYEKTLHCYSEAEWYITRPIIEAADAIVDKMLAELQETYSSYPYAQTKATIRLTNNLCQEEIATTAQRINTVHNALENCLSMTIALEATPRIALCLSGGGMRAAICSYALVAGLADIDLLDAVTFCAALSGSTWFLTDWITFGQPFDLYHDHFVNALSSMRPFSVDALANALWPKYIFQQNTGIVDLYGVYLAHTFLNKLNDNVNLQKITFSSLDNYIKDGSWPFPICTAVESSIDNHWVTFTPYEVGSDSLHFHMPTWAFGRKFAGGKSLDYAPEQSLGFFMGLWGSSLSGSLQNMLDVESQELNPLLFHKLSNILIDVGAADFRWAAIKMHNPLYGVADSPYRVRNITDLIFIDGAYNYNLPLPPLVKKERAVDIIIFMDASEDVHEGTPEFKKAIADISSQGIPLPQIDFTTILQKPVSIFSDPANPKAPIIIYIVAIKQDDYDPLFDPAVNFYTTYKTTNFSYKQADIDKLAGLIRFGIAANKDAIIGAVKDSIVKKDFVDQTLLLVSSSKEGSSSSGSIALS